MGLKTRRVTFAVVEPLITALWKFLSLVLLPLLLPF